MFPHPSSLGVGKPPGQKTVKTQGNMDFQVWKKNAKLFFKKNYQGHHQFAHLSHEKKPCYFPLYWLINRDPYSGLLQSLYTWVVIPFITQPTRVFFIAHLNFQVISKEFPFSGHHPFKEMYVNSDITSFFRTRSRLDPACRWISVAKSFHLSIVNVVSHRGVKELPAKVSGSPVFHSH